MKEQLSQKDAQSYLQILRLKIPPHHISPLFVETKAAKYILDRAYKGLEHIRENSLPDYLIVNATRGSGKTATIQYFGEQIEKKAFFLYQDKCSTSKEDLFRFFINSIGKEKLTQIVESISIDPMEVYETISKNGHNGTAIALAGLLENNPHAWTWLSTSSPSLPKLECGLRLVKNVRDNDAFDALSTIAQLVSEEKPIILALDELESAYDELTPAKKQKLRSMLLDLINYSKFSHIFFIFVATEPVYEKCFKSSEADAMGLSRRVSDVTLSLGLPTREEFKIILEKMLNLYGSAHGFTFSEIELEHIRKEYKDPSILPSKILEHALRKGDEKWESIQRYQEIMTNLQHHAQDIIKEASHIQLGNLFEESVGIILKYIPGSEYHIPQTDATAEGEWLKREVRGLRKIHKFLDWSFRCGIHDFWIEVCRTKKSESVIPSNKALALFAKTLHHEGSFGLFITHNYNRFGIGRGAGKVFSRFPELMKRVKIIQLDNEQFNLLLGIIGIEETDRRIAAQFLLEKTGILQTIEYLRGGTHFF